MTFSKMKGITLQKVTKCLATTTKTHKAKKQSMASYKEREHYSVVQARGDFADVVSEVYPTLAPISTRT